MSAPSCKTCASWSSVPTQHPYGRCTRPELALRTRDGAMQRTTRDGDWCALHSPMGDER